MQISALQSVVEDLLGGEQRGPVVVHCAIWPFSRILEVPPRDTPALFVRALRDVVGNGRDLLMPTFTRGYQDGRCDLDSEPCTTGVVAETFRRLPGTRRSLSAFFSFAILGPGADELAALRPEHAWGDGSAYDWMEKRNATFLMLGTHPTHCSYLHRMEWLARDRISYRYLKTFHGTILRGGTEHEMVENLFVRCLAPAVINDFTVVLPALLEGGMQLRQLEGISLAGMTAVRMRDTFLPMLRNDPLVVVKNRHEFH